MSVSIYDVTFVRHASYRSTASIRVEASSEDEAKSKALLKVGTEGVVWGDSLAQPPVYDVEIEEIEALADVNESANIRK